MRSSDSMQSPLFPPSDASAPLLTTLHSDNEVPMNIAEASAQYGQSPSYGMRLEVNRLRTVYKENKEVTEKDTISDPETRGGGELDEHYAFTILRRYSHADYRHLDLFSVTTEIHIRSPYFAKAAQVVMKGQRDVAWQAMPLKFPVEQLLAALPAFETYLADLRSANASNKHPDMITHLHYAVEFFRMEFKGRLDELKSLLKEDRITFELLWGIFVPGSVLLTVCPVTRESLAVRLINSFTAERTEDKPVRFILRCESVDFNSGAPGLVPCKVEIPEFTGAKAITSLDIFPITPYLNPIVKKSLTEKLIARGRTYKILSETPRHMHYSSLAYYYDRSAEKYRKISVNSRIMVDRSMFNIQRYDSPTIKYDLDGHMLAVGHKTLHGHGDRRTDMTDDEYLITPTRLYGFSFRDREWLEFFVDDIQEISWRKEPFEHLDLPDKKELIKALVETHGRQQMVFDDFVEGKGLGLVINLHGPVGVGKTLTAEATSEGEHSSHSSSSSPPEILFEAIQCPLYMVSAGDFGTTAEELDETLRDIFILATAWRAVLLIDEADVFLEKRSDENMKRNAMVSVFLRQLEYYPGILILTTNRVSVFDEAIQSRIHLSLRYNELTIDTRRRLWIAFLQKAGLQASVTDLEMLACKQYNGREIKNFVKMASAFASSEARQNVHIDDVYRVIKLNDSVKSVNGTAINNTSAGFANLASRSLSLRFPLLSVVGLIAIMAAYVRRSGQ